jgi:hypothetical protein
MKIILIFLLLGYNLFSQNPIILNSADSTLNASLKYLQKTQINTTKKHQYYKGEWIVQMDLTEPFFFMHKAQKAQDSNCFNLAAIHNFLSEIYLTDTTKKFLLPILENAYNEIESYQQDLKFSFWKNLPANRNLSLFGENKQLLVKRPTNFKLKSRFINKAANVPADADDTALGNTAIFFQKSILNKSSKLAQPTVFDEYLDSHRNNRNWYNYIFHRDANSGSFMTWLYPEHNYSSWNVFQTAFNTLFIFFPFSSAHPHANKPWVPFNANDVDVVVNANVLNYLNLTSQADLSEGYISSTKMINKRLEKHNWKNGSVYYPNLYHIHFAVSKAFFSGTKQLKPACDVIFEDLKLSQEPDGGFSSKSYINNQDRVQSTAYALHAMLDLRKCGYLFDKNEIDKAVTYLNSEAYNTEMGVCWEGGVYFSGGTALRNILFWKSDAYTTALVSRCLQKYIESN